MDDDFDAITRAAGGMRFQEPHQPPFLLNPLSNLPEPRRHLKKALKERIRGLMGAYISLATFVKDEEVFAVLDDPERFQRVFKEVIRDMGTYETEIREFLKELADSPSLDS